MLTYHATCPADLLVSLTMPVRMLTTSVYAGYQHNPPAISFMGKKTWKPGKALQAFLTNTFNVSISAQKACVEQIGDAMADVAPPQLREVMRALPTFEKVGAGMMSAWQEGLAGLRNRQHYVMPAWEPPAAFSGLPATPKLDSGRETAGRSDLLAKRR